MRNAKRAGKGQSEVSQSDRGGRSTRNPKEPQTRAKVVPPRDQLDAIRSSAGKEKNRQAKRPPASRR